MIAPSLLSLFDAYAACPVHASLVLHETDGSVAAALRLWCESRDLRCVVNNFEAQGRRYHNHEAHVAVGVSITVIETLGPVEAAVSP